MADDVRDEELLAPVPGAARDGVSGSARAGLFVTFEGGDGAGKTTQIALAQAWLEEQGHAVVTTREPGGTELGVAIRQLILHGDHVAPRAEALLYAADRAHHVETLVRPALERGDVILQDRYIDSSIAYQGAGRGLSLPLLRQITAEVTGGLTPGLTVLLDLDPALGLQRAARRGQPDRLEQADLTFHRRVRQGFLDLAHAEPQRFLVLDATRSEDELEAEIWAAVSEKLG